MTILLVIVVIVTVCLGVCIPFKHEETEKAAMNDSGKVQGTILSWLKAKSIKNDVEYYDVPFTSLDRFLHLAKVMEKEFTLFHYNQANSSQLSEKIRLGVLNMNLSYSYASEEINLLSDFQQDNAAQFAKIYQGVWFSTAMDCYRFKWRSELSKQERKFMALHANHKRRILVGNVKRMYDFDNYFKCKKVQYAVVERAHIGRDH